MAPITLFALLLPAAMFVVVLAAWRALTAPDLDGVVRSARRRSLVSTAVTTLAGGLAIWWWGDVALVAQPIRLATMPALAGTVAVLAASVAELTWPRQRGPLRQASLTARRGLPAPFLRSALLGLSAAAAAALATGALTAGGTGTQLTRQWVNRSVAYGPYPGLDYVLPMAAACVALLGSTALGLWLVSRRPGLVVGHDAADRALRSASMVRVLRGAVFGMGATAAGLLLVMGQAAIAVTGSDGYPSGTLRLGGFVAMALGLICAAVAVAAVVWPAPRLPGDREAAAVAVASA